METLEDFGARNSREKDKIGCVYVCDVCSYENGLTVQSLSSSMPYQWQAKRTLGQNIEKKAFNHIDVLDK